MLDFRRAVPLLLCLVLAALAAPAAAQDAEGYAPNEINEARVRLIYGIGSKDMGLTRWSYVSRPRIGWVTLTDGSRLVGTHSFSISNKGLGEFSIAVESSGERRALPWAQIAEVVIDHERDPYSKEQRLAQRNWLPDLKRGYIMFRDGLRLEGRSFAVDREDALGDWLARQVRFSAEGQDGVAVYTPRMVWKFGVADGKDGKLRQFIAFNDSFVLLESEGERFGLFKNPDPEIQDSILSAAINGTIQSAAATAAARGATRDEMRKSGDAFAAAGSGAVAGGQMAAQTGNLVGFAKPEYFLIDYALATLAPVDEDGIADRFRPFLKGCPEFDALEPKERKKLLDFGSAKRAVKMMNRCAGAAASD